ncbi:MAG: hypothetical protein M1490_04465 [Candidatus Bathyarchaeota archaeon]|nr:hypothetical protein [Candidatus Bathyarchaeota archaeon]
MKTAENAKNICLPALKQLKSSLFFTGGLENKLTSLIAFSAFYGLFFINYIDIITAGSSQNGYHLWLVLMYFLPFVGFSLQNLTNWRLTLGLGLTASLMNDVFYGGLKFLFGLPLDINWYYSNWLIPQGTQLFSLNLGFAFIPVYSWMMALSIYIRIAIVALLFWTWAKKTKNNGLVANRLKTTAHILP